MNNKEKKINFLNKQHEQLLDSVKSLSKFKMQIKNNITDKEMQIIEEIEEKLESSLFKRCLKNDVESIGKLINKFNDNCFIVGHCKDKLEEINKFMKTIMSKQQVEENNKIQQITASIGDWEEEEVSMLRYYIERDEFKELL